MATLGVHTFECVGISGELRHGYQVAARFGKWTLTTKDDAGIVSVSDLEPDAYWFDQQPQSLRLDIGSRVWVWREIEQIGPTQFRVLGEPEVD